MELTEAEIELVMNWYDAAWGMDNVCANQKEFNLAKNLIEKISWNFPFNNDIKEIIENDELSNLTS